MKIQNINAITLFVLIVSCSKMHHDFFEYENLYLRKEFTQFDIQHFKEHVGNDFIMISNGDTHKENEFRSICNSESAQCRVYRLTPNEKDGINKEERAKANPWSSILAHFESAKNSGTLIYGQGLQLTAEALARYSFSLGNDQTFVHNLMLEIGIEAPRAEQITSNLVE